MSSPRPVTPRRPRTLTFITSNAHKLAEVRAMLGGAVDLQSCFLDLVEIQAGSVQEIARDKCRRAAAMVNGPVLTEDTALGFTALGGLPGPYIKWFVSTLGHTGLNNLLAAYHDKSADAICTFAFSAGPGQEPLLFQGKTTGRIVPARGAGTFGWDPIFEYEGKTYAEMDKSEKNLISHRYKALEKLKAWLAEENVASNT
ncbi:hypothetical protein GJ744_008755 [Endocarpon pusillum]|uniref:Inosine triphosphate pyrophosphatase n=1 Tax=Endocarpon pusillum TaxID=364733 RepID=A0A8H7EB62_9EURO|nr:hypothetical protein GJ744_008755 [Endocarpon pusillum]